MQEQSQLQVLQPELKRQVSLASPPITLLITIWSLSILMLNIPMAENFTLGQKLVLLLPAILLSLFFIFVKPQDGFTFWVLGITFLVTQTGFQADIGGVRSSALEIVILVLLVLLVFMRRQSYSFGENQFRLPGQRVWIIFVLFSVAILLAGLFSGSNFGRSIWEFKGFILYPFMAYLFLAGIRDESTLRITIVLAIAWYVFVAGRGLLEFTQGQTVVTDVVYRVEGEYAPTNLFGITLAVMATLVFGVTMDSRRTSIRLLGWGITGWLALGMLTSVSRSALAALVLSIAMLFFLRGTRRGYVASIFVVLVGFLGVFPSGVSERLFQLSDSSTVKRITYLESGWQAFKQYWLTGAGWGKWFLYEPGIGLIPVPGNPWYHNDYLNLVVQIGIFGLLIYLLFWGQVFQKGYRWLQANPRLLLSPYVRGSLAALFGLLIGAFFDHVLWRSDMGGLVGWMLGILLAAINLHQVRPKSTIDARVEKPPYARG